MKQFQQKLDHALKLVPGAIKAAELKLPCYSSWKKHLSTGVGERERSSTAADIKGFMFNFLETFSSNYGFAKYLVS